MPEVSGRDFREFEDRATASEALARAIWQSLSVALQNSDSACFVASGGGSPKETYQRIAELPLAWEKVRILPSDERCVPEDSPRSNLGMIRMALSVNAQFVPLNESSSIHAFRPFDVVLLGMGEDGHTASLFPTDPDLESALTSSAAIHHCHALGLPESRISLTPAALLDAKGIFLLFFGSKSVSDIEPHSLRALNTNIQSGFCCAMRGFRFRSFGHLSDHARERFVGCFGVTHPLPWVAFDSGTPPKKGQISHADSQRNLTRTLRVLLYD